MVKIVKAYPFLCKDRDRQGNVRWRLRAPGRPTTTIKGSFGSPEFAANYRTALEGPAAVQTPNACVHGTIESLAKAYLRSAVFAALATETKRKRRYMVEQIVDQYGTYPAAKLEHKHVKAIIDGLANKPGAARGMLTTLKVLMAEAIDQDIRKDDPTLGIKRPKLSKNGWHTWAEEEIAVFEARHSIGSPARLAFALALYTSQRNSDLIRMGRQHIRDGMISVIQQKTGARLWIPIHSQLKIVLDAAVADQLTLLISETGRPYAGTSSFSHAMKRWTREAGLTNCPLHGLRKACCRRLAEAGCSTQEIMSISGHVSLAEVERYTKSVDQKHMAARAMARMERS
jgi:integrase